MRRGTTLFGAYALNSVVRPDWKQWFSRQDRHAAGRERVAELRSDKPRPMDLEEANKLVELFTIHHNFDDLSFVIKYIREQLNHELQPQHYHSLMRLFNFSRDRDNFEQMLEVVTLRDKDDMDTYARVIDQIHAAGGSDSLSSILEIVELAEKSFGSLIGTRGESKSFQPLANSIDRRNEVVDAPLLTSLLHHTCMMSYDLIVPILILAWKSALGAHYVDWDFANFLSALLSRADEFNDLASIVGIFDGYEQGFLSFSAIRTRLEERSMLIGESAPLTRVVRAMEKSLDHHKCERDTPFSAPLFNRRVSSVDGYLRLILKTAANAPGVNAGAVYHTTVLLLNAVRKNTEALEVAAEGIELFKKYEEADVDEEVPEFTLEPDFAVDLAPVLDSVSRLTHRRFASSFTDVMKLLDNKLNDSDLDKCSAIGVTFLTSEHQIRDIIGQVSELIQKKNHVGWGSRNLVKNVLRWCGVHPPRNMKFSAAVLAEREKWAQYIAARDTALALFGSGSNARDSMKLLFYNKLKLATVRDESSIAVDIAACAKALDVPVESSTSQLLSTTTASIGGNNLVPRHLHDPTIVNPFPHIILYPMDSTGNNEPTSDVFPELYAVLKKCKEKDWYVRDTEVYILLMRCLIHRLDWEAAVELTLKLVEHSDYTALMDQELITFFAEMGDPMGLLALKIVTKIYDGRIHVDGKSKREKFQEQQV